MLQQAEKDVYATITLAVAVYNGHIEVSVEELLEVYYQLWKWLRQLKQNSPESLMKIAEVYDEIFQNSYYEVQAYFILKEQLAQSESSSRNTPNPDRYKTDEPNRVYLFLDPYQLPS